MFLLVLDSEQAAIVRHSLAAARGYLAARLERSDPDQVLSKALQLQDLKCANLDRQLDRPMRDRIGDLAPIFDGPHKALVQAALAPDHSDTRDRARDRLAPILLELLGHGVVP